MKLLVIDDHEVTRAGVAVMLKQKVAEATSANALRMIDKVQPDVVLLGLEGLGTLEAIRKKYAKLPIVAFAASDELKTVARTVQLGVADYLLKSASHMELSKALRKAAKGEASDNPLLKRSLRTREYDFDQPLTGRQMEVVRYLTKGKSNGEIARELQIGIETVKEHVQNILKKLHVDDRTEAAIWAVRQGLA